MATAIEHEEERLVANYLLGETLGKGGYSWVKKGTDKTTGSNVAMKFMARADQSWEKEQANHVRTEIKSMIRINSKHVMKLYAYNLNASYPEKSGKTLKTILLVLEYCPGGELFDILYYCSQLEEKLARTYFKQLIQGLEDCHKAGIVHRDIKPQNLLLDQDYQLKITDFGLSFIQKTKDARELMGTCYVGTRGYQAPELLSKKAYDRSCDIFSAGVVLFILLTGYPPFEQGQKIDKWYRPLYKEQYKTFWLQHKGCGVPVKCQSLIEGMLAYKPKNRITIEDIKEHEWFKGPVYNKDELKEILRSKHAEMRYKRLRDKNKMSELNNSVKVKRSLEEKVVQHYQSIWGESPPTSEFYSLMEGLSLPKLQKDETTGLTRQVNPVRKFLQVCESLKASALQCSVELEKEPGFLAMVTLNAIINKQTYKFEMQVSMVDAGDEYVFGFRRFTGEVLIWHKVFKAVETYLLAQRGIFGDFEESRVTAIVENTKPASRMAAEERKEIVA